MFNRQLSRLATWLVPVLMLCAAAGQALADPPGRVARLSYVGGDVSMQPAGFEEWAEARVNRPLVTGDSLYSDRASRVEMEVGAATVRLDERTTFRLLNLDDDIAQIELTAGTLNLTVRRVFEGQTYEIDTPTLALVIQTPGQYRVDVAPDGDSTMVSVIDGNGDVYGRDNASFHVRDGESYRFYDSRLQDYEVLDLPRQDDFDRWCYERTDRYERSPSRRYVSEEVIGYADLDAYGSWGTAATYGSIWYPSRVSAGWAPYRDGHWSWIDPWGWTWVDNAPWGFAPSHYGRWAYVGSRWGWVPGPRHVRPIYAPALVAFVGGGGFSVSISSGGPIGWFPLGPRDVYVPWYRGSRSYFNDINVRNTTIINNTYITNVYNNYSRGQPITDFNYAYRNDNRAYTAVPRDAFINARSVSSARVQVAQSQLSQGRVVSRIDMAPTARSFAGGNALPEGRRNTQAAAAFDRGVIARTAPPMRRLDAQERIRAISRNNNQPLAVGQMRELATTQPRSDERQTRRVQVVGGERPAATAVPSRNAADGQSRIQRQARPDAAGREGNARDQTPANTRSERNRDAGPAETIRAPRNERIERNPPASQPRQAIDRDQQSSRPVRPRANVERDAPARTINAPEQRRPTTIRANPEAVERNRGNAARDPEIDPPARRSIEQRQPVQREQPARRDAQPTQERRVAPQPEPRNMPQQERREVSPRNVPQQRSQPEPRREVAPVERRQVQPRNVPQPEQRRAVQPRQPVQDQPAPKSKERKSKKKDDSSDDNEDNQRKRRE